MYNCFEMVRVERIGLSSYAWEAYIIAIIRYPQKTAHCPYIAASRSPLLLRRMLNTAQSVARPFLALYEH